MIKKKLKQNKKGFTIIEFSISLIFISIILVAVCFLTIQISQIYQKGLVIRAINSAGREIMDEMTQTVSSSQIVAGINPTLGSGLDNITDRDILEARKKYFLYNQKGDDSSQQTSGIFCTGSYDYVWNTADTVKNNDKNNAVLINNQIYKFARIPDTSRKFCATDISTGKIKSISIPAGNVINLINSDENDLALYDLTVYPAMQSESTLHTLYSISFIIATTRGGININANGDYCRSVDDPKSGEYSNQDFNYCAVNRFDFVIRQTGESTTQGGYGTK